jgi:hypothetical protein
MTIELITIAKSRIDLLLTENECMVRKQALDELKIRMRIKSNLELIERLKQEIIELERFYLK